MRPEDEYDQFISEQKRHELNMAADAAFCAAMRRAIRYRQVKVKPGTLVDHRPLLARQFVAYAAPASCGSPAAMCAEAGGAVR